MIAMDETVKKLYEDMCRLEEEMQALSKKVSKLIDDYEIFQYELKEFERDAVNRESTYSFIIDDDKWTTGLLEEDEYDD